MEVSGTSDLGSIPSGATKAEQMFYAYVLKSINNDYYYKGHCEDLNTRLKEHNPGMTTYSKAYIPFKIIYREEFDVFVLQRLPERCSVGRG